MFVNIEDLKDVYRCLYETNLVAAEDDYPAYYESGYAPDSIGLDEMMTEEDVKHAICNLVREILNDTGDEELTREWAIDAGADDELLAMCDL